MNAVARHVLPTARRAARRPKAQLLFRSCAAHVLAYARHTHPHAVAADLYPNDVRLRTYLTVQRGVTDPALTDVSEWAGNLARETYAEFLDLLLPESVHAQLSALGLRTSFEAGKARVPGRDSTPTLAGDFIGENQPIPVRRASTRASVLPPKRLAVISAFSHEMSTATGGKIEDYIRQFMVEDTAALLDARLLDANPATAIRPAGLLNGATVTPSAGITVADIKADLVAALAPVLTAGGGRRLVWLMNPIQALSLGLQTDASGAFLWPTVESRFTLGGVIVSVNVPTGTLILLDAADFATASDDVPTFDISDSATLHMDDVPAAISDGTFASPVTSLFQQDSYAVRMIQQMNWTMRRPGMVSAITGIAW